VFVVATDGSGRAGSVSFTWTTTNTVSVTSRTSQSSAAGSAIATLTNAASDTQSGQSFTWTATGLPTGLSINATTGSITGTPSTSGVSSVTVTATDGAGFSGTISFSWTITSTISITNPGNQSGVTGTAITPLALSATDQVSGSTITWSATGLPTGLAISATTGTISGTPTASGSFPVVVVAQDDTGHAGSTSFTWTITSSVTVSPITNRTGLTGTAVSLTPSATDSQSGSTLTWSATGLPNGVSIDSTTGAVTGTPATTGSFPVTVTATDQSSFSGSTSFVWTITNGVTVTNIDNGFGAAVMAFKVLKVGEKKSSSP
jgi:hypothetical protein